MIALQEAEGLISSMTPGEKAQLFRWIARDFDGAFPGIESDPAVAPVSRAFCAPEYRYGCSFRPEIGRR